MKLLGTFLSAACLALSAAFLSGCGSDPASPCASGFAVRFALLSIKEGLPLDSLFVRIAVGAGGPDQDFRVNLKTGVSNSSITAKQGQPYRLVFKLYSAGHEIGGGESEGRLACDLNVELQPRWADSAIIKAKEQLAKGELLPAHLTEIFNQALPGKVFELPLDSLKTGGYRWYVKLGDSTVFEGEGPVVRFTFPDSLAGKTVILRLLAVAADNRTLEERKWPVRILAEVSQDRLSRILVRTDTASKEGISLTYRYGDGRLVAIEGHDVLSPAAGAKPAWAGSLFYGVGGRLERTVTRLPDGSQVDSLFGYLASGRLAALTVKRGAETITDSLFHGDAGITQSRRYVDGRLAESATYHRTAPDTRVDSVFTPGSAGLELTRIIQNRFKGDSLAERTVLVRRGGMTPYTREVIAYNGLGSRAYRELYSEGSLRRLEQIETYAYDDKGRPASTLTKDGVTGDLLLAVRYEYAAGAAKAAAKISATLRAGYGSLAALADVRFAHAGWILRPRPSPARN